MALAFDKGPMFAIDKAAGEACRHLTARNGCAIHGARATRGFQGCIDFDCLGAGQRATAMFAGNTWREDAGQLFPMIDAFLMLRSAHEQIELLRMAGELPLSEDDRRTRDEIEAALWADQRVRDLHGPLSRARAFLRSLGGYLAAKAQP